MITAASALTRIKGKKVNIDGKETNLATFFGKKHDERETIIKAIVDGVMEEITENGIVEFTNVTTIMSPQGPCSGALGGGRIS